MVYAVFNYPDNGYDFDVEFSKKSGLKVGEKYEMVDAYVGQSHSSIRLNGIEGYFNSVQFDFENEYGEIVDIYRSQKYSPYFWNEYFVRRNGLSSLLMMYQSTKRRKVKVEQNAQIISMSTLLDG